MDPAQTEPNRCRLFVESKEWGLRIKEHYIYRCPAYKHVTLHKVHHHSPNDGKDWLTSFCQGLLKLQKLRESTFMLAHRMQRQLHITNFFHSPVLPPLSKQRNATTKFMSSQTGWLSQRRRWLLQKIHSSIVQNGAQSPGQFTPYKEPSVMDSVPVKHDPLDLMQG